MYLIHQEENDISEIKQCSFAELGIREREHLQEWLAKNPDVISGESGLLIIQKEFNGFSDTLERLDLLGLDGDGNLVIIENKLDDSGRDVVWQALKYTSYCSTLDTNQIIEIYQQYLDSLASGQDAKSNIMDFLGIERDEDLLLNDKDQKVVLVANHYRKEVTSTVLWLIGHDIDVRCFKATPFKIRDDIVLKVDQIIPVPEVEEYTIKLKDKQKQESKKSITVQKTEAYLLGFWTKLKDKMKASGMHYLDNVTPGPYFHYGFSKHGGKYMLVIGRTAPRVELYFPNDPDKKMIEALQQYRTDIEAAHDGKVIWERLDNRKASRVKHELKSYHENNMGKWASEEGEEDYIDWYIQALDKFYKAVDPYFEKVRTET